MEYRRGVWFRKHSEVPYDRITNVDTVQGPVQRSIGVGAVSLHTAGYASQTDAELKVNGIADYEDVKEQVLARVRASPAPRGAGTGGARTDAGAARTDAGATGVAPSGSTDDEAVLRELRAIRSLLESQSVE